MRSKIENIVVFGDSLSDRGTMAESALAAFSGLWGTSPHGRFTNGYVWLDYFIRQLSTKEEVQITPPNFERKRGFFSINNDEYVGVEKAPVFARTYCIGGMTSHDYSAKLVPGECMRTATAKFLENLDGLREEAFQDDEYMQLTQDEKEKTLVIEWSGANDLVTVNDNPTREAAELAVNARIQHIEKMIEQGYKHFVLFNLADLSLTPRYQKASDKLREQAHEVSEVFNLELQRQIDNLRLVYPGCNIDIFDANGLFKDAYDNPAQYDLDDAKKAQPFLDTSDFKDNNPNTTAEGYMFWDDVHPTEAMHLPLGRAFHQQIFAVNYEFEFTKKPLLRQFQKAYGMRLEDDQSSWSCMKRKQSFAYLDANTDVKQIVHHGLFGEGKRTSEVMQQLHWSNKQGECTSDNPLLQEAFTAVQGTDTTQTDALELVDVKVAAL